ncbi:MAG: hypothetical protein SAMD01599839_19380 [Rectinema sp.]
MKGYSAALVQEKTSKEYWAWFVRRKVPQWMAPATPEAAVAPWSELSVNGAALELASGNWVWIPHD